MTSSNPRPSVLWQSASTNYATACPDTFIISAQNVLREVQCMPRHVSSRTVVVDTLTGICNAISNRPFIVKRNFIHTRLRCPHR
jgi:hypothetical protein